MKHIGVITVVSLVAVVAACDRQGETDVSDDTPVDLSELTVSSPDCDIISMPWMVLDIEPVPIGGANRNTIDPEEGDHFLWNGEPIDRQTLMEYLGIVASMQPVPRTEIIVEPDDNCDRIAALIDEIENFADCQRGQCGLRYVVEDYVFEPGLRDTRSAGPPNQQTSNVEARENVPAPPSRFTPMPADMENIPYAGPRPSPPHQRSLPD